MSRFLTIATLVFLTSLTIVFAQKAPDGPPPVDNAARKADAAEKTGDEGKTANEPKPDPAFASHKELQDFFEPLRGDLLTRQDKLHRERTQPKPEDVEKLAQEASALDRRIAAALAAYVAAHGEAADAGGARFDLIELRARLGEWANAVAAADAYVAAHEKDNADLTRQARFMRADALLMIDGKEEAAATAFRDILRDYADETEADLARARLLRALLYLGKTKDAKALLEDIAELPSVRDDEKAQAWVDSQLAAVEKVGTKLPEFTVTDREGKEMKSSELTGKPLLLWYWDTQEPVCVSELKILKEVASARKDKLAIAAVGVNKNRDIWRQFIKKEDDALVRHYYEGLTGDDRGGAKLGVDYVPLIVLVNADGTIHRFDAEIGDLERVLGKWLGK